jgi:predicted hotdog family 3-hydroxylacyl-ACP dehydratase
MENDELKSILPHRGKMLLLSKIKEYNLAEGSLSAEYLVTEDCIFYDFHLGGVPAWAAFEFLAQAISALTGLRCREMGLCPNMGFILSIPSMIVKMPVLKLGKVVEMRVKECDHTDLIFTFSGEAFLEGAKVIEGKLMVMEIDEEKYSNLRTENNFAG